MAGELYGRDETFINDVNMSQGLVVLEGADQDSCKLPTGDDPTAILGVAMEGRSAGKQERVRRKGTAKVQAGGTCTRGKLARVLTGGTVEDVQTNATPAAQTVLGQFRESGTTGQYVTVDIQPEYDIVQ